MKTNKLKVFALVVALTGIIASCDVNQDPDPQQDLLPEKFSVDIPDAISYSSGSGRTKGDTLKGNTVYINLATLIAVGDGSAKLVEEIIGGIRKFRIDRVLTMSFKSDDDHRTKNLDVQA